MVQVKWNITVITVARARVIKIEAANEKNDQLNVKNTTQRRLENSW